MKKNLLFRCAKLSTLNERDIRVLENLKPHAIIDFRDPKEIEKAPDNLSSKLLEKYINLPISASTLSRMVAQKEIDGDSVKSYEKVMEDSYKLSLVEKFEAGETLTEQEKTDLKVVQAYQKYITSIIV